MSTTPRSPGRPAGGSDARERLLTAADDLLTSVGSGHGVSVAEILRRARVTAPTLYHHFGDKDTLLRVACERRYDALAAAMAERCAGLPPREGLRAIAAAYLDFALTFPGHYRVLFMGAPGGPAGFPPDQRPAGFRVIVETVSRVRPELDPEELTRVAVGVWAQMHGVASLTVAGLPQPIPPAQWHALLAESVIAVCAVRD